ncbi:14457_t:CDS:2, partial [Entrophospora sp. SA101]
MPKLKRKIKLCKELAAAKKTKTSNKNNLVNIEAFNNDNDVENLGVEELSNNVVEGDSSNEVGGYLEIEIDEDFEWFDNEIEKNAESLYDVLSNNIENKDAEKNGQTLDSFFSFNNTVDDEVNHEKENYSSLAINKIELKLSAENLSPGYRVHLKAVQKYL